MSVVLYIVLIGIALGGIHHWIKIKSYIFEHEDIASITKRHVGRGIVANFSDVDTKYVPINCFDEGLQIA